jgi:hypothetical protein
MEKLHGKRKEKISDSAYRAARIASFNFPSAKSLASPNCLAK